MLTRVTRSKRRLRFLIGVGIVAFGGARMCYLAWPWAVDVLNSTAQRLA